MSTAEQLLDSMNEEQIALYSHDPENESHIVIDTNRFITVPEELRRIAVQHDHNIETVIFDCPRYWDGHDLSKMKIYVNYMRTDGYLDTYHCDKVTVDGEDTNIMHFAWVISGNVTEVKGTLSFLVCAKTVDDEGNQEFHWNTELNKELYVSEGLNCVDSILTNYPDIVTHILTRMDDFDERTSFESMIKYIDTYFRQDPDIQETLINYVNQWLTSDPDTQKTIHDYVVNYIEETWAIDDELKLEDHPAEAKATGIAIRDQIKVTDERDIYDSYAGGLKIASIMGRSEQDNIPGAQMFNKDTAVLNASFLRTEVIPSDGWFVSDYIPVNPNTTYYFSGIDSDCLYVYGFETNEPPMGIGCNVTELVDVADLEGYWAEDLPTSFTIPEGVNYIVAEGFVTSVDTLMLNVGDTALPYEPYNSGIPTPHNPKKINSVGKESDELIITTSNKDGSSETSVTLPLADGIYATPTSYPLLESYTDKNGQMWCSDEFDSENKLYIQRVAHYEFTGDLTKENWSEILTNDENGIRYISIPVTESYAQYGEGLMCSHAIWRVWDTECTCFINENNELILGGSSFINESIVTKIDFIANILGVNPIELIYPLKTPVVRDLTDEEITALYSLKAYDEETHIVVNEPAVKLDVMYGSTDAAAVALTNSNALMFVGGDVEDRVVDLETNVGSLGADVDILQTDVSDLKKYGIADNLIPYPYKDITMTRNGITWTDNGDGTITANGTATAAESFYTGFRNYQHTNLTEGIKYTFSGCPSGGSEDSYYVEMVGFDETHAHLWGYGHDYGEGKVVTAMIVEGERSLDVFLRLVIKEGVTVNNLTFKPMLEVGTIKHDYTPYSLSRAGLGKSVSDGKAKVAGAITAKGVNTATDAEFDTLAANIGQIKQGSGNAQPENVDEGVTFSNSSGDELTGTSTAKAFRTAVVDGLQYSGMDISADTPPNDVEIELNARFPEYVDVLADLITNGITSTGSSTHTATITSDGQINGSTSTSTGAGNLTISSVSKFNFSQYKRLVIDISRANLYNNTLSIGYTPYANGTGVTTWYSFDVSSLVGCSIVLDMSGTADSNRYLVFRASLGKDYYIDFSNIKLIADHSFEVAFDTVDKDTVTEVVNPSDNSKSYYMKYNTVDKNGKWNVSNETAETFVTNNKLRMFYGTTQGDYFRLMAGGSGNKAVFNFTVPETAYYDIYADVVTTETGCYADIYIDDDGSPINRVDTYAPSTDTKSIYLGTRLLTKGDLSHKIKIINGGKSSADKAYPSFAGFRFVNAVKY